MSLSFSVVLGYLSARRNPYFYPIVKELSKEFSIGVLVCPFDKRIKTQKADDFFLSELEKAGAKIIPYDKNTKIDCNYFALAYVPRKEVEQWDLGTIVRAKRCGLCFSIGQGTSMYIPNNLFVQDLLVPDLNAFICFLEHPVKKESYVSPKELQKLYKVIQVGSAFYRKSYFINNDLDYVIAIPGKLSMPTVESQISFLEETHLLLDKIGNLQNVYIKKHNVKDNFNSFSSGGILSKIVPKLPPSKFSKRVRSLLGPKFMVLYRVALYKSLLSRVKDIKGIVEYPDLCIEMFLPRVRKGIITGFSNTIWHALLSEIPVFSTLDESCVTKGGTTLNRQLFGVPHCNGCLTFDSKNFSRIDSTVRESNYIAIMRSIFYESTK